MWTVQLVMHLSALKLREELTLKSQVIDKEKRRKDKLEKDLQSCQVRACPTLAGHLGS